MRKIIFVLMFVPVFCFGQRKWSELIDAGDTIVYSELTDTTYLMTLDMSEVSNARKNKLFSWRLMDSIFVDVGQDIFDIDELTVNDWASIDSINVDDIVVNTSLTISDLSLDSMSTRVITNSENIGTATLTATGNIIGDSIQTRALNASGTITADSIGAEDGAFDNITDEAGTGPPNFAQGLTSEAFGRGDTEWLESVAVPNSTPTAIKTFTSADHGKWVAMAYIEGAESNVCQIGFTVSTDGTIYVTDGTNTGNIAFNTTGSGKDMRVNQTTGGDADVIYRFNQLI